MSARILERQMRVVIDGVDGVWTPARAEKTTLAPGFKWGNRSKDRLSGLHQDLVRVMNEAIRRSPLDLTVLEGLRTQKRQRELFHSGASRTMNSRHLTGHAVDVAPLVNGKVSWDWPLYHRIAPAIKHAAENVGVPIEWGGDWESFKDGPHWQLPWSDYPA